MYKIRTKYVTRLYETKERRDFVCGVMRTASSQIVTSNEYYYTMSTTVCTVEVITESPSWRRNPACSRFLKWTALECFWRLSSAWLCIHQRQMHMKVLWAVRITHYLRRTFELCFSDRVCVRFSKRIPSVGRRRCLALAVAMLVRSSASALRGRCTLAGRSRLEFFGVPVGVSEFARAELDPACEGALQSRVPVATLLVKLRSLLWVGLTECLSWICFFWALSLLYSVSTSFSGRWCSSQKSRTAFFALCNRPCTVMNSNLSNSACWTGESPTRCGRPSFLPLGEVSMAAFRDIVFSLITTGAGRVMRVSPFVLALPDLEEDEGPMDTAPLGHKGVFFAGWRTANSRRRPFSRERPLLACCSWVTALVTGLRRRWSQKRRLCVWPDWVAVDHVFRRFLRALEWAVRLLPGMYSMVLSSVALGSGLEGEGVSQLELLVLPVARSLICAELCARRLERESSALCRLEVMLTSGAENAGSGRHSQGARNGCMWEKWSEDEEQQQHRVASMTRLAVSSGKTCNALATVF